MGAADHILISSSIFSSILRCSISLLFFLFSYRFTDESFRYHNNSQKKQFIPQFFGRRDRKNRFQINRAWQT